METAKYIEQYEALNFLGSAESTASPFFNEWQMEINKDLGRGKVEIVDIHNGLYVEMADYTLKDNATLCIKDMQVPLKIAVTLSGNLLFQLSKGKQDLSAPGDIMYIHGAIEQANFSQPTRENSCGFSICLPQPLIESWLGESSCEASKALEKIVRSQSGSGGISFLGRGLSHTSEIMHIARELMVARRSTLPDKLHFESLALDLLSHILSLEAPDTAANPRMQRTRKTRAAIDEAVDILQKEWNIPPTIAALSRRVGLNDCYLKKGFREQMGMPIGAYIRQLRMQKALEMIETGQCSVLETAIQVGYSNPGHFSAAFKKFYGHLPSYYVPRKQIML